MGPIPEDLIVFLLFAAFVLAQILRNWRRKRARRAAGPPVATGPADMQTQAEAEAETPVQPEWTPTLVEGPRPKPPARARQAQAPERSQTRRFSRRMLMGDRRSLQDAIVVATILGPCRAQRPRDME